MHTTLIDPEALAAHLTDPDWIVVDCRFDLADPSRGEASYLAAHVPGARYAHLDRDLSGVKTGANGRHPLPSPEQMAARFGALGVATGRQVVAYDDAGGAYAARLWWMLRFMGHDAVAVLDGGFARWTREGRPVKGGAESWAPATFSGAPREDRRLDASAVRAAIGARAPLLVDARSPDRFRGVGETLDKVGGHIPGAVNFFWRDNLEPDDSYAPASALAAKWRALLGDRSARDVVVYCGSGVTACADLLALEHAGMPGARLYPGSWSEWSADDARPVER